MRAKKRRPEKRLSKVSWSVFMLARQQRNLAIAMHDSFIRVMIKVDELEREIQKLKSHHDIL